MTHCVFVAYDQYLMFLGVDKNSEDFSTYALWKQSLQGAIDANTEGMFVPWILHMMVVSHPELLISSMQHSLFTRAHYLAMVESNADFVLWPRMVVSLSNYGNFVPAITLAPAIYLLLNEQHAVFSTRVPNHGRPVMAIQLTKLAKKGETNV